jgi:hypothetical protein
LWTGKRASKKSKYQGDKMKRKFVWTTKQIAALEGSIRKWEKIVSGKGFDGGTENCPCCKAFIDDNCRGCPISIYSGDIACRKTPYTNWCDRTLGQFNRKYVTCKTNLKAANAELEFLKKLLKAGTDAN